MERDALLESLETLNQSLSEISKRLGRLERSALPFDFEPNSSDEASRVTSLLALANDAIRRLSGKETQPEILEAFLELIAPWVGRSALFLNRGGTLVPWRASGIDLEDLERVKVDEDGDSLMARSVREKTLVYAEDQKVRGFGWVDEENLPRAAVAVPFCFNDLVPVVLYADADHDFSPAGLEFLSLLATLVLKNHALQQHAHGRGGSEQAASYAPPAAEPLVEDEASPAPEAAESSENPVPLTEVAGEEEPPGEPESFEMEEETEIGQSAGEEGEPLEVSPEQQEDIPDELAAVAAESPEEHAEPEFVEEAQTDEEGDRELAAEAAEGEAAEVESAGEDDGEEKNLEDLREEALRFARLLVSEIKLYNSEAVEQGRESSDIYHRLRHDIDRSREMYQRRAHPRVRSHEDCFDSEVVRILAAGDRDLLGNEYPGPRVE